MITLHPRPLIPLDIRESRGAVEETEMHRAHRSIAMFSDNDLGNVFLIRVLVVLVLAVDEDDDVGVLLDAVVDDDVTRDEVVQVFDGQIVDVCFAVGFGGNDLVPEDGA